MLYSGMTNDLKRRVYEHKAKLVNGFAERYNADRLVYFEVFGDATSAITREKQIKAGPRRRKVALIEATNPRWKICMENCDRSSRPGRQIAAVAALGAGTAPALSSGGIANDGGG